MGKVRQIECLSRLNKLEGGIDQILEHLFSEALVNKETVKTVRSSPEPHKEVYMILNNLSSEGKIQLLEYEWTLLPIERIKLTIVSNVSHKEFSHNF
jgi:hypothetical protein